MQLARESEEEMSIKFLANWWDSYIGMNFHIIRFLWNEFPEPLAREYKTHNEFHKNRIKQKSFQSFYHTLNLQKCKKNTDFSSFIADFTTTKKTRQRRRVTYDVMANCNV